MKKGDTIKCSCLKEWIDIRNDLESEGYKLSFKPGMVIVIKEEANGNKEDIHSN